MKLPPAGGKRTVEALLRAGFLVHRVRGGHYISSILRQAEE